MLNVRSSRPSSIWPPIAAGLAISIGYIIAATWLAYAIDYSRYPEIQFVCERLSLGETTCRDGAVSAGISSLFGLMGAAFVAVVLKQVVTISRPERPAPEFAGIILSVFAIILCGLHVARDLAATEVAVRQDITGKLISLENLLWPLLLQFFVSADSARQRLITGSALFLIATLSPFRGVIFSIAVFGGAVPLFVYFSRSSTHKRWLYFSSALVLLLAFLSLAVVWQTRERQQDGTIYTVADAIAQRVAMPLFQAQAAEILRRDGGVPTVIDNIASKIRLSSGPNLNQLLFRRIYGEGAGETTALLYGEAVTNFSSPPVVWIGTFALIPIVMAVALRSIGVALGTVCAIAIWRGSLGGMSDVIPALVIQLAAGSSLLFLDRPLWRKPVYAVVFGALTLIAAGHLASTWNASRHNRLIGHFTMDPMATQAMLKCSRMAEFANLRALSFGALDSSISTTTTIFENKMMIYVGAAGLDSDDRYRLFKRVEEDLSSLAVTCNSSPNNSVKFDYSRSERAGTLSPMDFICFLLPAFGLFIPRRENNPGLTR